MNTVAALISLLAVTVGFVSLVVWVYWPSRRGRLESYGRIPLESDSEKPREKPDE